MELRYPWFRRLPADQRAGILLVTQTSVANFVEWLTDPQHSMKLSAGPFRTAPRDLSRWVSLRQTVDLVRVATSVFEQQLPELAGDDAERALLTEASLRYSREVAFAAASAYAGAAEARGAWDWCLGAGWCTCWASMPVGVGITSSSPDRCGPARHAARGSRGPATASLKAGAGLRRGPAGRG